jgi:predicted kinase
LEEKRLIMLSGLTACGKTTASKALQGSFNFPLASTHAIKSTLRLHDTCSERERDLAYAELYRQAREVLAAGRSIILDAGFNTRSRREPIYRLAQACVAKLYLVSCVCDDLAVIEQRVSKRRDDPLNPENQARNMATYYHVKGTSQPVGKGELPPGTGVILYDTLRERLHVVSGDGFAREICRVLVQAAAGI